MVSEMRVVKAILYDENDEPCGMFPIYAMDSAPLTRDVIEVLADMDTRLSKLEAVEYGLFNMEPVDHGPQPVDPPVVQQMKIPHQNPILALFDPYKLYDLEGLQDRSGMTEDEFLTQFNRELKNGSIVKVGKNFKLAKG